MKAEERKTTNEAAIRALIEERVTAVHAKDLNAAMRNHAPDVLMFDVVNPLQYSGSDAVRHRIQEWFGLYPAGIGYEVRDLRITAAEEIAFCHYLYRVTGTTADGGKVDMWVRATLCLRKIDGRWLVTHDHESVPFDPETGKASLDIKP